MAGFLGGAGGNNLAPITAPKTEGSILSQLPPALTKISSPSFFTFVLVLA